MGSCSYHVYESMWNMFHEAMKKWNEMKKMKKMKWKKWKWTFLYGGYRVDVKSAHFSHHVEYDFQQCDNLDQLVYVWGWSATSDLPDREKSIEKFDLCHKVSDNVREVTQRWFSCMVFITNTKFCDWWFISRFKRSYHGIHSFHKRKNSIRIRVFWKEGKSMKNEEMKWKVNFP